MAVIRLFIKPTSIPISSSIYAYLIVVEFISLMKIVFNLELGLDSMD